MKADRIDDDKRCEGASFPATIEQPRIFARFLDFIDDRLADNSSNDLGRNFSLNIALAPFQYSLGSRTVADERSASVMIQNLTP